MKRRNFITSALVDFAGLFVAKEVVKPPEVKGKTLTEIVPKGLS